MSYYDSPRARTRKRCYGRINGKHSWLYVGGTTARCVDCGAERHYDPAKRAAAEERDQ